MVFKHQSSSQHFTFLIQKWMVNWLIDVICMFCVHWLFVFNSHCLFTSQDSDLVEEIILGNQKQPETKNKSGQTLHVGKGRPCNSGLWRWQNLEGTCGMVHIARWECWHWEPGVRIPEPTSGAKETEPLPFKGPCWMEQWALGSNYKGQRLEKTSKAFVYMISWDLRTFP